MGDRDRNSRSRPDQPTEIAFPRRRLGRVEHDHRGNARMEWALLPDASATDRPVLELLEEPPQDTRRQPLKAESYRTGFEPYQRVGSGVFDPPPEAPPRKPKDLRKLGEWLKMTRELEERRRRDDTEGD